jgi:hypothetical protein
LRRKVFSTPQPSLSLLSVCCRERSFGAAAFPVPALLFTVFTLLSVAAKKPSEPQPSPDLKNNEEQRKTRKNNERGELLFSKGFFDEKAVF